MSVQTETSVSAASEVTSRNRARLDAARAHLGRIERATAPFTETSVLQPLNELAVELSNVGSECGLLSEVHPEEDSRKAAEEMVREASRFQTELLQHRALYAALGSIDEAALDEQGRRVVMLVRRDMRRAGMELDDAGRLRVRELREELVTIGQEFSRNIRDDVRGIEIESADELAGMPADYVAAHPPRDDGAVRITTDYPDYIPFMSYARSGAARRRLAVEYQTRATPRNLAVLDEMLAKRHELARLLGYPTWADYATEVLMMETADDARSFIARAYAATVDGARADRELLLAEKRRDDPSAATLGDWEATYYTERVKSEQLGFDARTVRPYFEYRAVRQAILDLVRELFGIEFRAVDATLWHPSVETFDVTVDGEPAGRISLDMHPRDGKFKHAACFSLRRGVAGKQEPHPVLVCNFPDPATTAPALMEHREVVTFFHEFGHLIHGIVTRKIPWARLAGVTEWDFVEAPSQFLEEWIYDFAVLRRFAKHVDTGEPISEELVRRLRAARDFGRGQFVQRQLYFSALALAYHDRDPKDVDTTRMLFELATRYSPTEIIPESRFQASFGHLEGYTSNYFTYMNSLVVAKDFTTQFRDGFIDPANARRYRDVVLAQGGTKHARQLIAEFLGRPFSFEAFREWLAPK